VEVDTDVSAHLQRDALCPVVGGAFFYLDERGSMVARDLETAAVRFVLPVPRGSVPPLIFASGDHVLVRTADAWLGVEPHTGAVAWRVDSPRASSEAHPPHVGGGLIVEARPALVLGLDARTGLERFRRSSTFEAPTALDTDGLGLLTHAQPSHVLTFVGLDGTERRRIEPEAPIGPHAVLLERRATTLAVELGAGVELRSYPHDGGPATWTAGPFAQALDHDDVETPSLARVGDSAGARDRPPHGARARCTRPRDVARPAGARL
jgi:hypothetical protein